MSGVDIDQTTLDMDTSDDNSDPFDDDNIDLLCVHYTNLSIEAYNERRLSWADMVEEEMSSAEYWSDDKPELTSEPETYTSSSLSFSMNYSEDTQPCDSKLIAKNNDKRPLENFCVEEDDEDSWSTTAQADEDKGIGLQKIRLSTILTKQVGRKTKLRDLVLLRAASKTGRHDICASDGDYGKAWRLVNSWDTWISDYISDYFWRDLQISR